MKTKLRVYYNKRKNYYTVQQKVWLFFWVNVKFRRICSITKDVVVYFENKEEAVNCFFQKMSEIYHEQELKKFRKEILKAEIKERKERLRFPKDDKVVYKVAV
jgi:hypothetical protein